MSDVNRMFSGAFVYTLRGNRFQTLITKNEQRSGAGNLNETFLRCCTLLHMYK